VLLVFLQRHVQRVGDQIHHRPGACVHAHADDAAKQNIPGHACAAGACDVMGGFEIVTSNSLFRFILKVQGVASQAN
jgi:hypothetical protein